MRFTLRPIRLRNPTPREPSLGRRSGLPLLFRREQNGLARISRHLPVEVRNTPAITALRLLAVLNVLFKYTSVRRASRALY